MLLSLWIIFKDYQYILMELVPDKIKIEAHLLQRFIELLKKAEKFFNGKVIDQTIQRKVISSIAFFFYNYFENPQLEICISKAELLHITHSVGKGFFTRMPEEFIKLISTL